MKRPPEKLSLWRVPVLFGRVIAL
eukprot:jgi/Galph1/1019/GphlegSOOS_G5921.1